MDWSNGSSVLDTKSCKGSRGRVGLSFCWDAFGIEEMVGEKMISTSFDTNHVARGTSSNIFIHIYLLIFLF